MGTATVNRRSLSRSTALNTVITADDETVYDADDEGIYDMHPRRRKIPCRTGSHPVTAADAGDESFVIIEDEATTGSEIYSATTEDDDSSTTSFAFSSTMQPTFSPIIGAPSINIPNSLRYAHNTPGLVRRSSVTGQDMWLLSRELYYFCPQLSPSPEAKAPRRHKPGNFTIYEDETAAPPGWSEDGFTDDGGMAIETHQGLNFLDQGQENQQPVSPQAFENPSEVSDTLDEGDRT